MTIHSEDRDINKWPYSNNFAIELPVTLHQLHSINVSNINISENIYIFTNDYQNTKLKFSIQTLKQEAPWAEDISKANTEATTEANTEATTEANTEATTEATTEANTEATTVATTEATTVANLNKIKNFIFEIEINEGNYYNSQMCLFIQNIMNLAVTKELRKLPGYEKCKYNNFKVYYDNISSKIWFGNTHDSFILHFDTSCDYILKNTQQPNVWKQYTNWGLPSYLGFKKQSYKSANSAANISYDNCKEYNDISVNIDPDIGVNFFGQSNNIISGEPWLSKTGYFVRAPLVSKVEIKPTYYLEIEKYNNMLELEPYSEATSNVYNNDYSGRVNSSIASFRTDYGVTCGGHIELTPEKDNFPKLKLKFRHHDGRLIEFKDYPISVSLSMNILEVPRPPSISAVGNSKSSEFQLQYIKQIN